jgi:hypothetical protein
MDRRNWIVLGGISALALGIGGTAVLLTRRPATGAQGQGGVGVSVTFIGGPAGDIPDPQGGHLPDLTTVVQNTGQADAQVTLSVIVETDTGGQTGLRWFAYPGQPGLTYSPDRSQVSLLVPAGQSVSVRWGTTWTDAPGSYRNVAVVEVPGMPSKQFTDSQTFTIQTLQPADAVLNFQGGPSGTISGQVGTTQRLGPLTTVLKNVGQEPANFTVSVSIQGPTPGNWYTTYGLPPGQNGVPQVTVTLQPGQAVSIDWYTNWTFAPGEDGTYQNVATVSW